MNPNHWLATGVFQSDDDFRHSWELVATGDAEDAFSIAPAWSGEPKSVVRVPIAKITQCPIGRESFTELPEVVDVQTEVCIVTLRIWSGLRCKKDGRDVMPPAEQIAARLNGPGRGFGRDRAQFGFPRDEAAARSFGRRPAIDESDKALDEHVGLGR